MHRSLAHRVAVACGALLLTVTVLSRPATASAQILPGGLFDPASPTPTPTELHQPGPTLTTAASTEYRQPDLKVTALGVARHDGGTEAYAFSVRNVGQAAAPGFTITQNSVVKRAGDKKFIRTDTSTAEHAAPLRPGQEVTVEVPCTATQHQYCDVGVVQVDLVSSEQDADPTNNHATAVDDIPGH